MCNSPRIVSRRSGTRSDMVTCLSIIPKCFNPDQRIKSYKHLRASSEDFFYHNYLVPCGHCSDCLKKRQADLAARCTCEANKLGSMVFVTLTYEDNKLPLSVHIDPVNIETGECVAGVFPNNTGDIDFVERGSEFEALCYDKLSKICKGCTKYVRIPLLDGDGNQVIYGDLRYDYVVTPSLCRRDVQLWLKSCRVQYEREFGLKLKKFSYVCCGEYGSSDKGNHRPHYHLAFFGLSKVVVDWMCSRWKRQFGFTYVKQVNAVNSDGTNGFELCARYIGKYMSKGCFDCDSVKNGTALKPRLMCSKGVGKETDTKVINDNLVSYYRCYDVVGEYDINSGKRLDGSKLSEFDLDKLASEVSKRCNFKIGNSIYPIPRFIKHAVWYEKNCEGHYVSSYVRRQVALRLQTDFFEDFVRKCSDGYSHVNEGEILNQINEFLLVQLSGDKIAEERGMCSLQKFYYQSKF